MNHWKKILTFLVIFGAMLSYACVTPTNGMVITSDTTLCGGTYQLNNGLVINANNVVLTCEGTVIKPPVATLTTRYGILVNQSSNVTIRGCEVQNYAIPIDVDHSPYFVSYNNTIKSLLRNYADEHIYLLASPYSVINFTRFVASDSDRFAYARYGIAAKDSEHSVFANNVFEMTFERMPIVEAPNCTNTWINNTYMNGDPFLYINKSGSYKGSYSEVYICNASDVDFSGNVSYGLYVYGGSKINIHDSYFNGYYGVYSGSFFLNTLDINGINITDSVFNVSGSAVTPTALSLDYVSDVNIWRNSINVTSGISIYLNNFNNADLQNNSIYHGTLNFRGGSGVEFINNNLSYIAGLSTYVAGLFENNSILYPSNSVSLRSAATFKNNLIKQSSFDGLYIGGDARVIGNTICGSQNNDIYQIFGVFPIIQDNTCDKSSPDGLCAYSCPVPSVTASILPQDPSSSDPIKCAAFVSGDDMDAVEFEFYINGVSNGTITVNDCPKDDYCYSPLQGPFSAGTTISCRARGVFGTSYTDWSMSGAVEVSEPVNTGGTDIPPEELTLIVSQECMGNVRLVNIFTVPDTRILVRKGSSLIGTYDVGNNGMVSLQLDEGQYSIIGTNPEYIRQDRIINVTSCYVSDMCSSNMQCGSDQICEGGSCINLTCGYCQYAENHICMNWQCCSDMECSTSQVCQDHTCVDLTCGEGEVPIGHECKVLNESSPDEYYDNVMDLVNEYSDLKRKYNKLENELTNLRASQKQPNTAEFVPKQELPSWLVFLTVTSFVMGVGLSAYSYFQMKELMRTKRSLMKLIRALERHFGKRFEELSEEDLEELYDELEENSEELDNEDSTENSESENN